MRAAVSLGSGEALNDNDTMPDTKANAENAT
jgi:hypothetical protein